LELAFTPLIVWCLLAGEAVAAVAAKELSPSISDEVVLRASALAADQRRVAATHENVLGKVGKTSLVRVIPAKNDDGDQLSIRRAWL
jgi:hypothetical protein